MRFSAVITCYNYGTYVCDAVDSALQQTQPPHEVVVINDGSTDDSLARLTARFGGSPIVRVITQENAGQMAGFSAGCSAAEGDVVCFLDADDLWEPDYLKTLDALYRQHTSPLMVLSNLQQFGKVEGLWHQRTANEDLGLGVLPAWFLLSIPQAPTSSISMTRALALRILDLPSTEHAHWRTRADDCLILGAQVLGARTIAVATPLVRYRVHDANSWSQKRIANEAMARYKLDLSALAEQYAARVHASPRLLGYAFLEFKTKPQPGWRDLLTYLWLQWRAPRPFTRFVKPMASMLRHYLQSRRTPS